MDKGDEMLTMARDPERKEGRFCAKTRNVKYLHELLDRVFINGSGGVGSLIMAFHGQDGRSGRQPWYMLSLAKKDWRALHRFETGLCMKKDLFAKYADLSRFPLLHSLQIYDPALIKVLRNRFVKILRRYNEELCLKWDLEKKNPAVIEKLCNESLVHTPNLHTLNLTNSYLMNYPSDVRLLSEHGLTRIRNLHTLKLRYTGLDNEGLAQLSEVGLAHVPNLRTLDLAYNNINGDGIKVLSEVGLAHVPHLHTLNIEGNFIYGAGLRALSVVGLAHVPNLRTLNISHNNLNDTELYKLFPKEEVLSEVGLHTLDLSKNKFCFITAVGWLRRFPKLRTLNLTYNSYINRLATELAHVPNLSTLALGHTNLGDKGLKMLSEIGLAHVPNLRTLDLSSNNIGGDGLKVFSEIGLAHVPNLRTLDLSSNRIGGDGFKVLCSEIGLTRVPHLNDIVYLRYLFIGLAHVQNLRTLDLSSINIGDIGLQVLSGVGLAHVPHLHTLYLHDNPIGQDGDKGLRALSVGLRRVPELRTLTLIGLDGDKRLSSSTPVSVRRLNRYKIRDIGMNEKIMAELKLAFNLDDIYNLRRLYT